MAATKISGVRRIQPRPITRYSPYDSEPLMVRPLLGYTPAALAKAARISPALAVRVVAAVRREPLGSAAALAGLGLRPEQRQRVLAVAVLPGDPRVVITDVQPVAGRIMSDRSFRLRVWFTDASPVRGLVSVRVEWAGRPFVVEELIGPRDSRRGYVDITLTRRQGLLTGPAAFTVDLLTDQGAHSSFRVTCAVLPSNPFALTVAPRDQFVTGTFSARAVRSGSSYVTVITVTLSNGNASAMSVQPGFGWEFWDGPVGSGTRVENGTASFGGTISVPAFGTWSAGIAFTSPSGSGVYNRLNGKEDLAVQITMTRSNGTAVRGEITVRTMFRFGLNITRVGAGSFTAEEYADLYAAVDVTRTIYERRDITLSVDRRHITNSQAGGFTVITSESEARALFEQWSGPDNAFIDVFVVPSISGTGFDGLAGDIPGPTSHGGRQSGVVVDKSGFVDSAGVRRLSVNYLGMLIGHEVGHYLGLSHVSDAGNLMLASSGASDTALNYSPQYRTAIRHGWVRID